MGLWFRKYPIAVFLPMILLIGWIDLVSGPELGFSLFYLAPIAFVAWRAGGAQGLICAGTAALCWLVADILARQPVVIPISLWNGFTRLVIYVTTATLIDRVKLDRIALEATNAELKHALGREKSLSRTDGLTGLPNSRAFLEHLKSDLARNAREGTAATLLFLDLDDFKSVNDIYGHAVGDIVLTRIGAAIKQHIRTADVAARLGGDEFVILLWHAGADGAEEISARITAAVRKIAADYPRARLGVSIGVAETSGSTLDSEALIRLADEAMYAAKTRKKTAQTGT